MSAGITETATELIQKASTGRIRLSTTFAIWLATATAIGSFAWLSFTSVVAKRGMDGGAGPIYGTYSPDFSGRTWLVAILGLVIAVISVSLTRNVRRPAIAITVMMVLLLGISAASSAVRTDTNGIIGRTFLNKPPEYQADVHLVREAGIRGFVSSYPDLVPTLRSHSNTHPPGALVVLAILESWFPTSLTARALVLALLGSLMLIPTYLIAREYTFDGAVYAPALLLGSPALIVFLFTCMDALFAAVMVALFAVALWGMRSPSLRRAGLVGSIAAGASFFTYAVGFVALAIVIVAFVRLSARRGALFLAGAGAGGLLTLVFLRLTLGFHLFASYSAFRSAFSPNAYQLSRSRLFWIFGNYGVWMMYAGVALVALALLSHARGRVPLLAMLSPVFIFYVLPTRISHLLPGETERTWIFLLPFLAVAGASALSNMKASSVGRSVVLSAFVFAGVAQAIALRGLFVNFY